VADRTMGERTEQLIQQIIDATKGRVSGAEIKSLTDDVRAHLDASIQARLDSQQSVAEAEEGAIEEFGPVEGFVAAVLARKEKGFGKATFACFLLGLLGIAAIFAVQDQIGGAGSWFTWAASVIGTLWLVGALWTGWRARRLQLSAMVLAYGLAVPAAAILLSFVAIGDMSMPLGEFPKSELAARVDSKGATEQWVATQRRQYATAENSALTRIMSTKGPYLVPVIVGSNGTMFKRAQTRSNALAMLTAQRARNEHQWAISLQASEQVRQDAARRLNTPFPRNALYLLPLSATLLGSVWLFAALIHGLAAFLSAGWKRTLLPRRIVV
jgi:hypothetical protein